MSSANLSVAFILPNEIEAPAASASPRPLLSVVLPQYGRTNRLDRFFRHHTKMLDESGLSYELLVVDDASPDETPEIVAAWSKANPNIRSIRHASNVGFRTNYLSCMREARGHFTVYVGNDDLLIGESLQRHLARMIAEPEIVMTQAPWFLLNEYEDNRISGASYAVEQDTRFFQGEQGRCLDFVLGRHVFPEWYIIRTDAVPEIVGPFDRTAYHFFTQLSHALDVGDVVFAAEPYAIVTAISRGADTHVGNTETFFGWDEYRGGLEYLAAAAQRQDSSWRRGQPDLMKRLQDFTNTRMSVAVRLHTGAKNWLNAWHLNCRLAAYGCAPIVGDSASELASLAAMESCLLEAVRLGHRKIVVAERCFAIFREVIRPSEDVMLICAGDDAAAEATAHISFNDKPEASAAKVIDLSAAMRRYRI